MTTIIVPPALPAAPSARDQQIFVQVEGLGRLQAEVAAEFQVSQSRVSEICKCVKQWRGRAKPWEAGELSRHEQARLDWYLERERLNEVIKLAMREFHKSAREARRRGV